MECENCKHYLPLKTLDSDGMFIDKHCCNLLAGEQDGWIQEVGCSSMCEMFTELVRKNISAVIENPCMNCKRAECKNPCYVQRDYYRAVQKIVEKRQKELRNGNNDNK